MKLWEAQLPICMVWPYKSHECCVTFVWPVLHEYGIRNVPVSDSFDLSTHYYHTQVFPHKHRPLLVVVACTHVCNLTCPCMCVIWSVHNRLYVRNMRIRYSTGSNIRIHHQLKTDLSAEVVRNISVLIKKWIHRVHIRIFLGWRNVSMHRSHKSKCINCVSWRVGA